jgi:hypothetical protein
MKQKYRAINRIADGFIVFAMLYGIVMLAVLAYFTLLYWLEGYSVVFTNLREGMYHIAILLAICWGIMKTWEGMLNQFAISYNNLFGRRDE